MGPSAGPGQPRPPPPPFGVTKQWPACGALALCPPCPCPGCPASCRSHPSPHTQSPQEVVADNGLSEKITVINKEPRNLEFGWEEYQVWRADGRAEVRPDGRGAAIGTAGQQRQTGRSHRRRGTQDKSPMPRGQPAGACGPRAVSALVGGAEHGASRAEHLTPTPSPTPPPAVRRISRGWGWGVLRAVITKYESRNAHLSPSTRAV